MIIKLDDDPRLRPGPVAARTVGPLPAPRVRAGRGIGGRGRGAGRGNEGPGAHPGAA